MQSSRLAVGRDARTHSAELHDALVRGITEEGVDVVDVGQCSTPMLYFATESLATGGVKVHEVVDDQLPRAMAGRWDVAVVSAGANDAIRAGLGPVIEAQLARIVDELLEVSARVILLGVGDLGSCPRALFPFDHLLRHRGKALDRVHFRIASDRERVYKVPMWERSAAEFNARDDIWAADHFHPNRHQNRYPTGCLNQQETANYLSRLWTRNNPAPLRSRVPGNKFLSI